jgi:FkbM family methyltransferase
MYSFVYNNENIYFNYVLGDHISNSWKNNRFYEIKLLEKIKSLNLNGLYVDVGSHHGNHSIYFDKFCNSEKVISIEGNPFNFNYLKMNITQNKCKNILFNIIASDKEDETLTMKYDMINTGSSRVVNSKINTSYTSKNQINNTTKTLDNLLKNEENISLIKLDIENSEYNALLGAQNIINKHRPVIIIELHRENPYYNEIINFLDKNNYKTDGINYATSPTFIYVIDSAF